LHHNKLQQDLIASQQAPTKLQQNPIASQQAPTKPFSIRIDINKSQFSYKQIQNWKNVPEPALTE